MTRFVDARYRLQHWESSLPTVLAFNDHNLQYHINRLDSGVSVSGWCYFYMHAIAECCVIAIEEVCATLLSRIGSLIAPLACGPRE